MRLSPAGLEFVTERHLASLTTLRADGTPHVVAVGFTWDDERALARVITSGTSLKVVHAEASGLVALCQIDGRRWLTVEGRAVVRRDEAAVAEAVARYTRRYREPRVNPRRVAIEIMVTRLLGSRGLLDPDDRVDPPST